MKRGSNGQGRKEGRGLREPRREVEGRGDGLVE